MNIRHILNLLLLIFTVEDLIGQRRTKDIENKWLYLSIRILTGLRLNIIDISGWLPKIITILSIQIASAILLCTPLALFLTPEKVTQATLLQYILFLIVLFTGLSIYFWLINYYIKRIDIREKLPVELQLSLKLKDISNDLFNILKPFKHPMGTGSVILIITAVFVIFGAVICVTFSTATILLRILISLIVITTWSIFFAPARLLAYIAKLLGADGYFKVGKYILLVFAYVASWFYQ